MRLRASLVAGLAILLAAPAIGDDFRIRSADSFRPRSERSFVSRQRIDLSATSPALVLDGELRDDDSLPIPAVELQYLVEDFARRTQAARERAGEGGALNVTAGSLEVLQVNFTESECPTTNCQGACVPLPGQCAGVACNVVLLIWEEATFNPAGVDLYLDDTQIGTLPGVPEGETNRVRTLFLGGLEPGVRRFRVEETNEGTFDELELEILASQPFGDASNVQCAPGPIAADDCSIWMGFAQAGPTPQRQTILFNGGNVLGDLPIPADDPFYLQRLVGIGGASAADWNFTVIGFLPELGNPRAQYRGCFRDSDTCTLDCLVPGCEAPIQPLVLQVDYDAAPDSPSLLVLWTCSETDAEGNCLSYEGVRLLANGVPIGNLPGTADQVVLDALVGDVVLGFQGTCGAAGNSTVRDVAVTVRAETPLENPVVDGLVERVDEDGVTTASWVHQDRSAFVFVFINGQLFDFIPGGAPGAINGYEVEGIGLDDIVEVQFFTYIDNVGYGSEFFIAGGEPAPTDFFVRGLCTGSLNSSDPQITDAILLLSFLFLGGAEPPCRAACDSNASGALELTDAIVVLSYLFTGGAPPTGWVDGNPTCEVFAAGTPGFEIGCVTPLATCTEAGPKS
jgi:hypothetical protein